MKQPKGIDSIILEGCDVAIAPDGRRVTSNVERDEQYLDYNTLGKYVDENNPDAPKFENTCWF